MKKATVFNQLKRAQLAYDCKELEHLISGIECPRLAGEYSELAKIAGNRGTGVFMTIADIFPLDAYAYTSKLWEQETIDILDKWSDLQAQLTKLQNEAKRTEAA